MIAIMASPTTKGALCGLAAAALFGASAPLAKLLLASMPPIVLSGLLYLGAALGLGLALLVARGPTREAPLGRRDLVPLAGVIVLGGMVSPFLMLTGLERVSGVTGALLLNLEAPFTMLIAVALFREHLGRGALAASGLIVAGGAVLGRPWAGSHAADLLGALAIAGACLGWGVDNNLSQR